MYALKIKTAGVILLMLPININAQVKDKKVWNAQICAVALTYDDGLNVHLDKVIPVLDSLGFNATFYIPGNSASLNKRMVDWRGAAANGHELGNHTLFHPCEGQSEGREWVSQDYDLNNYSINRIIDEIRLSNTLLRAIDGKTMRTFAYTCGDQKIGDSSFVNLIKNDFVAARGIKPVMNTINTTNIFDIGSFMIAGESGEEMINLVKKAMNEQALLVFLFHGVGGEHAINVPLNEQNKLLYFLKEHENEIWTAPLVEIAEYITAYTSEETNNEADHP
jgi:peptidoglycan/xylan/chitin deacetylase (PgdA/CDA1 family)